MDWIDLAQDKDKLRAVVNRVRWNLENFLANWGSVNLSGVSIGLFS